MTTNDEGIALNLAAQFALTRNKEKIEERIFDVMKGVLESRIASNGAMEGGLLIIYGDFEKEISDITQMGDNPFSGHLTTVLDEDIEETLIEHMREPINDGAVLVNIDGQILAGNIYLVIRNPKVKVPPNTGTRHIAASYFSVREDIIASFVLSETRDSVVKFSEGEIKEQHQPLPKEEKKTVKKAGATVKKATSKGS